MSEKIIVNEVLKEWRNSAAEALDTFRDFGYLMRLWQKHPPDRKEFMVMVKMMSDAGLEGWLDEHSLGLDALAKKLDCA